MKKLIIAIILIASLGYSTDIRVTSTHHITPDLQDNITLTESYTGALATGMTTLLNTTNKTFNFLATKYANIHITSWTTRATNNTLNITLHGQYNNYTTRLSNNQYKLGGKGFIDKICTKQENPQVPPLSQTFNITIHLPKNYKIKKTPEDKQEQLPTIYYNTKTTTNNNTIHTSLTLVTYGGSIAQYCEDRSHLNKILKQGIIIEKIQHKQPINTTTILTSLITISLVLLYINKKTGKQ